MRVRIIIFIFFHFVHFFSWELMLPVNSSLSHRGYLCVWCQAVAGFVYSDSGVMSTHCLHCPYLKWPEPQPQIKSQTPPLTKPVGLRTIRLELSISWPRCHIGRHLCFTMHKAPSKQQNRKKKNILEMNHLRSKICHEQQKKVSQENGFEGCFQDIIHFSDRS